MKIADRLFFGMVKAVYAFMVILLIWAFASWAEIAFTVKSPDTIPTYSGWNLFIVVDYIFNN